MSAKSSSNKMPFTFIFSIESFSDCKDYYHHTYYIAHLMFAVMLKFKIDFVVNVFALCLFTNARIFSLYLETALSKNQTTSNVTIHIVIDKII